VVAVVSSSSCSSSRRRSDHNGDVMSDLLVGKTTLLSLSSLTRVSCGGWSRRGELQAYMDLLVRSFNPVRSIRSREQ